MCLGDRVGRRYRSSSRRRRLSTTTPDQDTASRTTDLESRIYVAGHRGMVGSAIVRALQAKGYTNLITRTHAELDLTNQAAVRTFFQSERIDQVYLAAAKVGGIHANNTYPAEFIYQNLMIQTNVIHEAWKAGVRKLLFLGSSCVYPKDCPQPIKEEYLLTGPLEPTNEPYAIAKIGGIKMCESYNRQYGTDYRVIMPCNLYGPGDNYSLDGSHVIPGMMRKFHLAKLAKMNDTLGIIADEQRHGKIPAEIKVMIGINPHLPLTPDSTISSESSVTFWGSGAPYREFLHVNDLASAVVFFMGLDRATLESKHCSSPLVINAGIGSDLTIYELAQLMGQIVGYDGAIEFDRLKPDGTPKKILNNTRITAFGWRPQIALGPGIAMTYLSYCSDDNSRTANSIE